ncbi:MAG: ArsC/Spx/MgsR family protein [Woeseiaceae bacterium]|nr:ArsC/Spx/MgsR family protein [Woeseiaceae bacterium]
MSLTLYHNPRCSKSRKTLQLLESQGRAPDVVLYLENPPAADDILRFANLLGKPVSDLLRRSESVVRDADDLPPLDDDAALAEWISRHPIALQRPIVVDAAGQRAVIGRPPENVAALFDE